MFLWRVQGVVAIYIYVYMWKEPYICMWRGREGGEGRGGRKEEERNCEERTEEKRRGEVRRREMERGRER